VLVTIFDDVYGRDLTAQDLTIEELFERIKNTQAPDKASLPLFKLARFGSLRTPQDPNNPRKGNSLRHDANVMAVTGGEGDYDGESMPLDEAVARLEAADISFIAYTSPSHSDASPRWRVVCPFSKEVPPAERARLMNWLNGLLGGVLSRESWPISQCFYFGGINGPPEQMYLGDSERCLDEADFEATAQPFAAKPGAGGGKTAPDFDTMTERELIDVIESGAHYWRPARPLITMWAKQGVSQGDAESNLASAFDRVPQANRDKKWAKGRSNLRRWIEDGYAKALKIKKTPAFVQLLAALEGEPHWQRAVVSNTFAGQIEVCTPWPPKPGQKPDDYRELADADILEMLIYLQSGVAPYAHKNTVWDAVTLLASRNERHPVREWLRSLKWDGGERVRRLFLDYFPGELPELPHAQDQAALEHYNGVFSYYEETALCFMVSLVARVFEPGCKVDTLPCLVSPQGWLKSRGLQGLMPDPAWFSDDLATTVGDRDAKESMTGKWLIELSEFPHMRRDVDRVKAFFSRQTDRYRKAYGRANGDHPRQCVFCATTNELEFLDTSGNRRVWPTRLAAPVNLEAIRRDRDQLWAEAVHLYDQAYAWWLPPSLEAIAAEIQAAYAEEDTWDEQILDALDHKFPIDRNTGARPPFTLHDVLRGIGFCFIQGEPNCARKGDEMRAARRLRQLGYQRDPRRTRANGQACMWVASKAARS
jgi:predicted P-loop ATPase